jgi:hypothetical protein
MKLFKGTSIKVVLYSMIAVLSLFLIGITATNHFGYYTFSDLEVEFGMEIEDSTKLTNIKDSLELSIPMGILESTKHYFPVKIQKYYVKKGQYIEEGDKILEYNIDYMASKLDLQKVIVNKFYKKILSHKNSIEITLNNIDIIEKKLKYSKNTKADILDYTFSLNNYKLKINSLEIELSDLNSLYHKEKKTHTTINNILEEPVVISEYNGFINYISPSYTIENSDIFTIENTGSRTLILDNTYTELKVNTNDGELLNSQLINNKNIISLNKKHSYLPAYTDFTLNITYKSMKKNVSATYIQKETIKTLDFYSFILDCLIIFFGSILILICSYHVYSSKNKQKNTKTDTQETRNKLIQKAELCLEIGAIDKNQYITIKDLNFEDSTKANALIKGLSLKIEKYKANNII